jgi:hypothetical protein
MNHHQKHLSACLIALAALFSTAWAQAAPSLNTASTYAALAGGQVTGAVTCTDSVPTSPVTITGDVGVVPPLGTFTNTSCTIKGTVNTNAAKAYADFLAAYGQYSTIGCTGFLEPAYTTTTLLLPPGVYCNAGNSAPDAGVTFTTTTVTLDSTAVGDGSGAWIFKITGAGGLTFTDSSVVMANGGQACNVTTWWVPGAVGATVTRGSVQGIILAGADITMTGLAGTAGTPAPSSFNGDALAGGAGSTTAPTGAVTLTNMNVTSCGATKGHGEGHGEHSQSKCNQGVGNGSENCDPGHSDKNQSIVLPWGSKSNDENGGTPGSPGRKGGHK